MSALMEKIREENRSIFENVNKFIDCTKSARLAQGKAQAAELHQFQQNLQQETEQFLATTAKERIALQQETEQFLATTAKERIAQGKAQAAELHQFQQNLQQETEQFLATTAQERIAKAKAQAAELRQFRQDLFMSVIGGSGL